MNRRTQSAFKFLGVVLALANVAVAAGDEQASLTWTTGMEFSSGKYGGADAIEDLYVPITARMDYQRFTFELTVPYLSVRAPSGSTITEPGGEPVAGSGELSTESGLGDVIAGVTVYDVFYSDDLGVALFDGDAISELSAFASRRINDSLQVQFCTFTGFSDSSADWGAGFLLQIL